MPFPLLRCSNFEGSPQWGQVLARQEISSPKDLQITILKSQLLVYAIFLLSILKNKSNEKLISGRSIIQNQPSLHYGKKLLGLTIPDFFPVVNRETTLCPILPSLLGK